MNTHGHKSIDALALGKPVVAIHAGGIPEIIQDGESGRLVASADPAALAGGIIEFLANPERAKQMGRRGQEMIRKNFSVDAMVKKNIKVYQHILTAGRELVMQQQLRIIISS